MTCPAFGSSSEVKLYYAIDSDPTAAVPGSQIWEAIRMTGESLDANISASISEEITPERSYADSSPSGGEISGGFNMEMSFNAFDSFLRATLQSDAAAPTNWAGTTAAALGDEVKAVTNVGIKSFICTTSGTTGASEPSWVATPGLTTADSDVVWTCQDGQVADGVMKNGSTKYCYMFLKVVPVSGVNTFFVFRGCQIDGMTMSVQPKSNITGSVNVSGIGVETKTVGDASSYVYNKAGDRPIMTATASFQSTDLAVYQGASLLATFQNMELSFTNQLRQQDAVGTGSIYAAGVASGRFQATVNSSQYYADTDIFDNFNANTLLTFDFALVDSLGNTYAFNMEKVKITGGGLPQAGGPDQDLVISPTMQAFEHAVNGTLQITKTSA